MSQEKWLIIVAAVMATAVIAFVNTFYLGGISIVNGIGAGSVAAGAAFLWRRSNEASSLKPRHPNGGGRPLENYETQPSWAAALMNSGSKRAIEITAPPSPTVRGTNFYRSPAQVAILTLFADPGYLLWWLWQLFLFTKREGFPRARSFWWIFVPYYGLYVLYQQLGDLKRAISASSTRPTVNPSLVVALVSIGAVPDIVTLNPILLVVIATFLDPGWLLFVFVALSFLLAVATYLTQRAANGFLHAKYPEDKLRGITVGEIVAVIIGLVVNAVVVLDPTGLRGTLDNRVAPAGAPYSYKIPAGFYKAGVELSSDVTVSFATGLNSEKYSDTRDVILVMVHPLSQSLDGVPLPDIKRSADASWSSGPKAQLDISKGWVKINGMDALEYDYVGQVTPWGIADGITYFLFKGKYNLELDCRWKSSDKAEIVRGCDEVMRTLTFN